jgi:hypothetical protein
MSRNSKAQTAMQRASIAATSASADHAAFSRSIGLPPSMGKATCTVKTLVPDCVSEELTRLARESGMTVSDFLRDMVLVRVYGVDVVSSMQRRRLELAAGIGTEKDATR